MKKTNYRMIFLVKEKGTWIRLHTYNLVKTMRYVESKYTWMRCKVSTAKEPEMWLAEYFNNQKTQTRPQGPQEL